MKETGYRKIIIALRNTLKIFSFLFLLLVLCTPAYSQTPTRLWATYFGGDSVTSPNGIARDSSGNIYITGIAISGSGIATKGAYQTVGDSISGSTFLAKFNPSGSLLWATYYGEASEGDGIAIDKSGNVYISGIVYSDSGIASKGAYQTTCDTINGSVFLAKFNPSGNLLWGTYYGGSIYDWNAYVAADISGNVYITGTTFSTSGMATKGAYKTSGDSIASDIFLAKFNSAGSLLWGTYYGGGNQNVGWSIATYDTNVYITGLTGSSSGIATKGAYQTWDGGAYLTDFSASGALLWGTYYGGDDNGLSVATDISGNIYITGAADNGNSIDIATSGAYQTSFGGGFSDAFLAKFSSKGNLLWGTYFGGSGQDGGISLAFDKSGNVYMSGGTNSTSGIATSGAYQTSFAGGSPYGDGFIAKFTTKGNLLWATYYGGSGDDQTFGISTDSSNNLYVTGYTESLSGIATSGAYQTSLSGIDDAFLAEFHNHTYKNDAGIYRVLNPANNICAGSLPVKVELLNYGSDTLKSVKINWEVNGTAQTTYNWTGNLNTDSSTIINLGNYNFTTGTYSISSSTSLPNGLLDSFSYNDAITSTDTILTAPKANAGINQSICIGSSANLGGNTDTTLIYNWKSKLPGFISSNDTITVSPIVTTTYYLTASNSCGSDSDSVVIIVNSLPKANAGQSRAICNGDSVTIGTTAVSGDSYSWVSNPSGFTSTSANPSVTPKTSTTYTLTETIKTTGCNNSGTVTIKVNPLPDASFTYKLSGDTVKFIPTNTTYTTYSWSFGDGDTSDELSPSHSYSNNDTYTVSLTVVDKNGCSATYKTSDTINYTGILPLSGQMSIVKIYPNPFTNQTTISAALAVNSSADLTIYDMTGRVVVEKSVERGAGERFEYTFDPDRYGCGSGVYVVKLMVGDEVVTREIVRIR